MRRWDLISSFVSFVMKGSSSLLSLADLYMVSKEGTYSSSTKRVDEGLLCTSPGAASRVSYFRVSATQVGYECIQTEHFSGTVQPHLVV